MSDQSAFLKSVQGCSARLAERGADALGALFDLTAPRLVRFAVALTRQQQDAEDAVQAALVRLADRPQTLAAADCPWSYLLGMVRNEALQLVRRRRRYLCLGELPELQIHCPVDDLEQQDQHRAVWKAIQSLPVEQAEVVVLKIWEELTFAEIGAILSASPNTVASRYQYAMAKLSRQLFDQRPELAT
jgi:RNA polymerase sigma-70 factor (ECF subfamily)